MGKLKLPTVSHFRATGPRWHRGAFWLLLLIGLILFSALPAAWASTAIEYGYRDFSYPNNTGGNSDVTGEKPESKLWWNDGFWWGSLWSTQGDAYHIYRLDLATQDWVDTNTALDDRPGSRADALWDGQHLYVVSHLFDNSGGESAPAGSRGELYRYSYDSGSLTYSLDSGFPVEVTGGKSETLVLEKDSTGQLWVTYVENDTVMLNHSLNGNDSQWGTPFALPTPEADVDSDDISSIISYNQHIGVMWSNQDSTKEMYFAVHPDNAPDDQWTQVRAYGVSGDDHISLKSLEADSDGNVYAAIKTSDNDELIVLLVCERNVNRCMSESDWSSYPVYDNEYNPTRPILLIDMSNRELYIFTRNQDNGNSAIYYKSADLDDIQFDDGIGIPFIRSTTETGINDPTSTKQNLTSTTGLVVLASDSGPDYYFHNYKPLSGNTIQYTVTTNTVGAGSVSLDPPGETYDEGTTVSVTALADPGWEFSGWSGDLTGTTNPASLSMNEDKSITATFTQTPQYTLTVNTVGSGNVTLNPPGGIYNEGTEVTLTAQANAGWTFSDWSGDLTGTGNPATIVMDSAKTVTATFVPEYTLTVNKVGSGSVALNPPGGTYAQGTDVTLTATAAPGWTFSGWSGDLTGSTNPATITMNVDKTVTATFIPRHSLAVNTVGSGSVSMDPPGGIYDEGTVVSLTAEASSGWNFSGWSGDLAGTDNPTTITMDADKAVTATFSLPQYTLTVNVVGSGNVTLDPPGGVYDEGTLVAMTATPDAGWTFSGWSGAGLSGTNNPISIIMDGDKTVTATFSPPQYTLTVNIAGSGSVILSPPGGVYDMGTTITLTATANPAWSFSGWSGNLTGSANPATLTMDGDKELLATFVQKQPGIQIDIRATVITATVGQAFTYTYAVTNVGETTLSGVSVVDDRLGPVTLNSSVLSSGETVMAHVSYAVNESDLPGPLVNNVMVTGVAPSGEVVSDNSSISIAITDAQFSQFNFYMPVAPIKHTPDGPAANPRVGIARIIDSTANYFITNTEYAVNEHNIIRYIVTIFARRII